MRLRPVTTPRGRISGGSAWSCGLDLLRRDLCPQYQQSQVAEIFKNTPVCCMTGCAIHALSVLHPVCYIYSPECQPLLLTQCDAVLSMRLCFIQEFWLSVLLCPYTGVFWVKCCCCSPRNDIYEPNPDPRRDLPFSWLGLMATTTTTPNIPRLTVDFSALRFHLGCLEYLSCPLLYASSAASQRYLHCTISNCRVFKHKVRARAPPRGLASSPGDAAQMLSALKTLSALAVCQS